MKTKYGYGRNLGRKKGRYYYSMPMSTRQAKGFGNYGKRTNSRYIYSSRALLGRGRFRTRRVFDI